MSSRSGGRLRAQYLSMEPSSRSAFLIALNPEEDTKLPYLLHLPLEGGLTLKTRET